MIYFIAFALGFAFGFLGALYRVRQYEKAQFEIAEFVSKVPPSKILRPFAKSNKLKPKVNSDDKAVERENAF